MFEPEWNYLTTSNMVDKSQNFVIIVLALEDWPSGLRHHLGKVAKCKLP
jgi:hypothetical protein